MSFKPTLAVAADLAKLVYPVFASPKLDGIRCVIVDGKALTRSLKAIPNRHIYQTLSTPELDGLDGELIIGAPTSKTVYSDSVSGVMSASGTPAFTYFVFDLHTTIDGFSARLAALQARQQQANIVVLQQVLIRNETDLLDFEEACIIQGYEGVILRSPTSPYKFGRSTAKEGYMLKVKRFEDGECEIIGVEEEMLNGNEATTNELGRTQRSSHAAGKTGKGTMGALVVRDIKTGVEFSIGSGFTSRQRAARWEIGSLHKYKFFPVGMKDKPRHPVYIGARSALDL
jgi:DNA ligase-1